MTLSDLKSLHALNKEIELERRRLHSITQKRDSVSIIGIGMIPREEFEPQIKQLEERIRQRLKDCIRLYNEINGFISTIPDALTRLVVSLRYVNSLEWEQIAQHIGGGNTAESVRKLCARFIKKYLS